MTDESQTTTDDFEEELRLAEEAVADLRYEDALRQVLVALKLAEDKDDPIRQSRAHAEHARLLLKLGLFAEAVSAAHAALPFAEGDPASGARALGALGSAHQTLSPAEGGIRVFGLMLEKAREAADASLEAQALRGLCAGNLILHHMALAGGAEADDPVIKGYAEGALNHAVESTAIGQRADDSKGIFLGRHLHVGSLLAAGDLLRDRRGSEELLLAVRTADSSEADSYAAITLKLLGQIDLREEDVAAAERRTLQALALFERRGDLRQAADCFNALSKITERKCDYKAALDWLRRSTDAFERFASASARAHAAATEVREETARVRALAAAQRARADRLERSNEDLSREAARFAQSAMEDSLTGIANRRRLDQELAALIGDRRARQRCSLTLLDIDHFKQVNDRFLHTTGDKVLAKMGAILRQCSREEDLVARFGGEEFAIVFVNVDADDVSRACERVRQAVASARWSDLNPGLTVTVSIGFCRFDEVGDNLEELLTVADDRLFQAKRSGRNRVIGPTGHTNSRNNVNDG